MLSGTTNRRLLPLVAITGLTLLALDASGFGVIGAVRRAALSAGQPVGAVLDAVTAPAVGAWQGMVHHDALVDENRRLRHRLAEAEGRLAAQPDLAAEFDALAAAVDIGQLDDVERVTARVVADRTTPLERIVELDKGRADGVAVGMPVLTGAGLVGAVDEVVGDRSTVRLLTDARTAVGVRSRFGVGLVRGRPDGGLELRPGPELADALEQGRVEVGHRLVTSGLERSRFPAGVPVARVVPAQDPEAGVTVEPVADLAVLGYLTVLLVERPA
jgi:rod shape-determining protein MreC